MQLLAVAEVEMQQVGPAPVLLNSDQMASSSVVSSAERISVVAADQRPIVVEEL